MLTLQAIRAEFGDEIKDISDFDIAERIRTRMYPDMDPQEFYKQFGIEGNRGAVGRGLARGFEGLKGAFAEGIPALARSAMGDEDGARVNLEQYRRRMAETQARNPSRVADISQVQGEGLFDTLSRAGSYAGEAIGEAFPSLALVLAGAVTGGAAGAVAGVGRAAGQVAGATAAGFAPNVSESFVNLAQDGEQRPLAATLTGLIKTALDTIPAVVALRRASGELGSQAVDAAAGRIAQNLGVRIGKQASLEGLTEGAQAAVDQTAEQIVGLADSYDFLELVDNAAKGFLGAGPFAAGSEAMGRGADRRIVAADAERKAAADAEAQAQAAAQAERQQQAATAELAGDFGPAFSPVPPAIEDLARARREDEAAALAERLDLTGVRAQDDPRSLIESDQTARDVLSPAGDRLLGTFRRTAVPGEDPLAPQIDRGSIPENYEEARAAGVPTGSEGAVGPAAFNAALFRGDMVGPEGPNLTTEDEAFAARMGERRFEDMPETQDAGQKLATETLDAAAQGIVQNAPNLAPAVKALLDSTEAAVTRQKVDEIAAQVEQAQAETAGLEQSIRKAVEKTRKKPGSNAQRIGDSPVEPVATWNDKIYFRSGPELFVVGSSGRIEKAAGVPAQATKLQAAPQPQAQPVEVPPAAPTPTPVAEVVQTTPVEPPTPTEGPRTEEGVAQAVDNAPEVKRARNAVALKQAELNGLNAEYETVSQSLTKLGGKQRAAALEQLKQIGARRKAVEREVAQAQDAESAVQQEVEARVEPPSQAEPSTPEPKPAPLERANPPAQEAAQTKVEDARELLIDRIFYLPEKFTKDDALNAGFTDTEIGVPGADGLYDRQRLLDKAGYVAPAGAEAGNLPRGVKQSAALDVLDLAKKLDPDTILVYKPTPRDRRGQAADNWAQVSPEFSREVQIYTAIHEVGGHALGHLGKLSPAEVNFALSKFGRRRLEALVLQAAREGHPTLGGMSRERALKYMRDGGPMETFAMGVEAAAWYINNGKPVPNSPSWLGAKVRKIVAWIRNALSLKGEAFRREVQAAGFDDVGLFKAILDGTIGQRQVGMYPPVGALSSPFVKAMGYPQRHLAGLAQEAKQIEGAIQRALVAGNREFAAQLGARLEQVIDEATLFADNPMGADAAMDKSADPDVLRNLQKGQQGEAAAGNRLGFLLRHVATPSFVASMKPAFQPLWRLVQGGWIPYSHRLENIIKNMVDDQIAKTNDAQRLEIVRLMEATNSARQLPTIAGTDANPIIEFTVPAYADAGLEGTGLRHRVELSKPGDKIKLTGEAAKTYRAMTAAMTQLQQTQVASLLHRAGFTATLDFTDQAATQRSIDALRQEIERDRGARGEKETNKRLGALAKAVDVLRDQIKGYMPMVRYGDWTVRMTVPKPKDASERPLVIMAKTRREAEAEAARLRKRHPNATVNLYPTQNLTAEDLGVGSREDAIDAAHFLLEMALNRKDSYKNAEGALEELGRAVRDAKLDLQVSGMAARSVRRRDIAGHIRPDEEGTYLLTAVRPYLSQMAQHIAYNQYAPEINAELRNLSNSGNNDLFAYAKDSVIGAYLEPEVGVARAKAAAFAWTIGGNFSSAVINLTQLFVTSIPMLGATHGVGKSAAAIIKAGRDVARAIDKAKVLSFKNAAVFDGQEAWEGLSADEWRFMKTLIDSEAISQGLTTEMSGLFTPEGIRGAKAAQAFSTVSQTVQFLGKMFGTVEQFNRATTALAAYRLAKQANPATLKAALARGYGGGFAGFENDPVSDYAYKMLNESQGQFNKANRPTWQRGIWGVPSQFMQFPAFMMETVIRSMMRDPETRAFAGSADGAKMLGTMFGSLFFFGGLMASVPMAESVEKLLEMLDKALAPFGIKTGGMEKNIRKAITELTQMAGFDPETGKVLADVAARGVLRQSGIDISRRVQLDLPVLDTLTSTNPADFLGPTGSVFIGSLGTAYNYLREGQDTMAFIQLLPVAMRNLVRADMLGMTGASEAVGLAPRGGGDIISQAGMPLLGQGENKATTGEAVLQAVGFTPTKFSQVREKVEAMKSATTSADFARERFNNVMADYLFFAQQAEAAGRAQEAERYRQNFQRALQEQLAEDRQETDPLKRVVRDATSFRTALLTRLEQRRTGALGTAGPVRGRANQFFAEQATGYLPR